jgi:hypothetical protein
VSTSEKTNELGKGETLLAEKINENNVKFEMRRQFASQKPEAGGIFEKFENCELRDCQS